jgi:hypothetical protein
LRMERRNPALHAWRRLALKINRVMSSWEMRDLALAITGQLARGRLEGAAQNTLWRCLVRFACEGCCTTTHGLVECVDRAHHPVSAAHECAQCGREDRDPQRLPWHLSPAALPKASVGAACPQAGGKSRCPGPPDPDESGTGSLGWRGLRSLARFAVVQVPGPHQRGTAVRYPRVSVGRLGGGAPALPASHPHDPGTQARVCNECEGPGAGGFPDNAGAWFCGACWREYFRWRHESRLRALLRGLLAQDVGSVWIRISACLNEFRWGEEGMPGAAALSPGSEPFLAGTMTQGIPCGGRRQSAYRIRLVRAFSSTEVKLPHVSTRVHEHTPLEWFLPYVAKAVEWPVDYIALHAFGATARQRHKSRGWPATLLHDLAGAAGHQGRIITVAVELLPPPAVYSGPAGCICDFGGCCRLCFVPSTGGCVGCGNNGCCRSGDCGHPCCESLVDGWPPGGTDGRDRRCDRLGCRPWWCA